MNEENRKDEMPQPLPLTEPKLDYGIGEGVIFAVIATAVWAEGQRPGMWSKMMRALGEGAQKTQDGSVNAFLFRAMVDRLIEEFHALDDE